MTFTAMLMAGGESRRMGVDKALMIFEAEMLWQRQLRLLKSLYPEKLCVSARARPTWCPASVESILDANPSLGPLSGIAAGISHIQTSHLLVLAIDMPRITHDHLRKLLAITATGCGVVPRNAGRFEPLCAVYPAEAAIDLSEALSNGNSSIQNLIEKLSAKGRMRTYQVSECEAALYLNINTPKDLADGR